MVKILSKYTWSIFDAYRFKITKTYSNLIYICVTNFEY